MTQLENRCVLPFLFFSASSRIFRKPSEWVLEGATTDLYFISPEDSVDLDPWHGHFSQCPEELTDYCVHGDCRYLQEHKTPSCRWEEDMWWWRRTEIWKKKQNKKTFWQRSLLCLRCEHGFVGSRCEYLDLDWWKGEKQEIIIICIIAGLVLLILLILFICMCSK